MYYRAPHTRNYDQRRWTWTGLMLYIGIALAVVTLAIYGLAAMGKNIEQVPRQATIKTTVYGNDCKPNPGALIWSKECLWAQQKISIPAD